MMIGGALAGIVGDRIGRRIALIGSVLIFGVLTAAVAFVDSLWALAALRFLAGLGLGGAMPNAAALASEYVPRRHRPVRHHADHRLRAARRHARAFVGGHLMPVLGWRALFGLGGLLSVGVAAHPRVGAARVAAVPGPLPGALARARRASSAPSATTSRPAAASSTSTEQAIATSSVAHALHAGFCARHRWRSGARCSPACSPSTPRSTGCRRC